MFQNDSIILSKPKTDVTHSDKKTQSTESLKGLTDDSSVSEKILQSMSAQIKEALPKNKNVNRSVAQINVDSTQIKDSLQRVDSIRNANLKKIITEKKVSGNSGKQLASYPIHENWVFAALFLLLFVLLLSLRKSSGTFFKEIKSLFKKKDNISPRVAVVANLLEYRMYFSVFMIGVVSLYVQECFFNSDLGFHIITFVKILGVTAAFYLAKILLFEIIGNTFFNVRLIKSFKDSYFNLVSILVFFIFPVLILKTYYRFQWAIPFDYITLILIVFFYILLLIKVFQIFFTKLLDTFYIFLYLCTLEILPLFVLFRVYKLIV